MRRELHALCCERVEMRRPDHRMPEPGEAVPAPLIDGDEEDVASRSAHLILRMFCRSDLQIAIAVDRDRNGPPRDRFDRAID
jgi:hypothetical protein